jgi:hypothetical protein
VFERRLTHHLAVIAVDENYFDYYHRTSDFFTATGLVMHPEGIGVFGRSLLSRRGRSSEVVVWRPPWRSPRIWVPRPIRRRFGFRRTASQPLTFSAPP